MLSKKLVEFSVLSLQELKNPSRCNAGIPSSQACIEPALVLLSKTNQFDCLSVYPFVSNCSSFPPSLLSNVSRSFVVGATTSDKSGKHFSEGEKTNAVEQLENVVKCPMACCFNKIALEQPNACLSLLSSCMSSVAHRPYAFHYPIPPHRATSCCCIPF